MNSLILKSRNLANGLRNLCSSVPGAAVAAAENRVPFHSKCINKVTLMGRSVVDSRLVPLGNAHYLSFALATNFPRKTRTNELIWATDIHSVYIYKPFLAEKAHEMINKGTRVYLEGSIHYRKGANGLYHSNVHADELVYISGPIGNAKAANENEERADFEESQDKDTKKKEIDSRKCINQVNLLGRCASEATIKPLGDGFVTSFILTTNDLRRTKSNELVKASDFHRIFIYQPFLAQKAHKLITKGTRLYIEGELNYYKGENKTSTKIRASKVTFISGFNENVSDFAADDIAADDISEEIDYQQEVSEQEASLEDKPSQVQSS